MVKIETYELAFIYWRRRVYQGLTATIPSGATKTYLTNELGDIDPEEFKAVDEWANAPVEVTDYIGQYSPGELKTALEIRYRMTFPFPIAMLPGNRSLKLILSWFWLFVGGDDIVRFSNPRMFNIDQERVFGEVDRYDIDNDGGQLTRDQTKIIVVNAGPGTGKTTTANALAMRNIDDGVLLISYTNESIKENYRRLHEYPATYGRIGEKKWDKILNVVTVDSLAARIIGAPTETDHDKVIRLAISSIEADKFYHPTRGTFYQHVIVDECQDIDSLRGELILKFCNKLEIKTLTLFGDPRQRIRNNCGEWYSQLWTMKDVPNVVQVPLTISYRFGANPKILEIVNNLSERRPSLHVTLRPYRDGEAAKAVNIQVISDVSQLVELINDQTTDQSSFGQWAVIGPTVDRSNKTAVSAHYIATVFRGNGIRCYFRSEGAFVSDAVAFLTIHSAKGREFDNVVLFGMNNYPSTFPMIPPEEAESLIYVAHSRARKRIYYIMPEAVMDTEMVSSSPSKFIMPRGLEESDFDFTSDDGARRIVVKQTIALEEIFKATEPENHPHFSVTDLIDDHGFTKFLTTNRLQVTVKDSLEIPNWEKPVRPDYISKPLWGILLAIRFQSILNSDTLDKLFRSLWIKDGYIVKSKASIVGDKAKGKVIFGRDRDSRRLIIDVQPDVHTISLLKNVCKKDTNKITFDEWEFLAKCYSRFICGNDDIEPDYVDRHTDCSISNSVVQQLPTYDPEFIKCITGGTVEQPVTMSDYFHGQIDYLDPEGNIYEFKTCGGGVSTKSANTTSTSQRNILQAWLYFVMSYAGTGGQDLKKNVFVLSLTDGKIHEISSERNVEVWKYVLRCYHQIYYHNTLVQQRKSYMLDHGLLRSAESRSAESRSAESRSDDRPGVPQKSYFVDTEFDMKTNDVFEIACVDFNDVYSTFVLTARPKTQEAFDFAIEWTGNLPKRTFDVTSMSLPMRFKSVESITLPGVEPTFYHYLASVDHTWYSSKYKVNVIDLGQRARTEATKFGMFSAGNMPPKLGELYTLVSLVPLESQSHLRWHWALSDALMLYELVTLGLI